MVKNAVKLQKVICQKSQKLLTERASQKAAYSEHSIAINSVSVVGYVTTTLAFVCCIHRAQEVSSFCDVTAFFSFLI